MKIKYPAPPSDEVAATAITLQAPLTAYSKNWVERFRRPLSFLFAAMILLLVVATKPRGFDDLAHSLAELCGFGLIAMGTLGRIWCAVHITSRKNRDLCMSGPYSSCRNPLYFFSFVGAVGVCLAAQSFLASALIAVSFLAYYKIVITTEERRLGILFGKDYQAYRLAVPRFWPRWTGRGADETLQVNAKAMGKAIYESSYFLLMIIVVELVEKLKMAHGDWFITLAQ